MGDGGPVVLFLRRHLGFHAIVIGAAAIAQLTLVALLGNRVSGGDATTYLALADDWTNQTRLLSQQAFDGNFWPAGYSGFLAIFHPFGGNQIIVVRVVQVLMVLVLAMMVSQMASRVSTRSARLTLVLVAFCPTLTWGVWAIGYELLLGFLITFTLWQMWRTRVTMWAAALSGASLGLALIVQFRAIAVFPVVAVLVWRNRPAVRVAWVALFAGILALWSLRTRIATGSWVPWSGNSGYNLWDGNGPHATGHNVFPLPVPPSQSYSDAAIHWIFQNPSQAIELIARKGLFLFYPTLIGDVSDRLPLEGLLSLVQWLISLVTVALLVLFVGAMVWQSGTRLRALWPLFAVVTLFLLPNVIFIVEARFRVPVEALIMALCAATACELWDLRESQASSVPTRESPRPS